MVAVSLDRQRTGWQQRRRGTRLKPRKTLQWEETLGRAGEREDVTSPRARRDIPAVAACEIGIELRCMQSFTEIRAAFYELCNARGGREGPSHRSLLVAVCSIRAAVVNRETSADINLPKRDEKRLRERGWEVFTERTLSERTSRLESLEAVITSDSIPKKGERLTY